MLYDENRYGKEGNKFSKNSGICFDVIGFLRSPVTLKKADSYLSWNIPRFQVSRLRPVIQRRMEYFLEKFGIIPKFLPRKMNISSVCFVQIGSVIIQNNLDLRPNPRRFLHQH